MRNQIPCVIHKYSGLRLPADTLVHCRTPDISITAHGGIINGILAAAGRPPYALPTGGKTAVRSK